MNLRDGAKELRPYQRHAVAELQTYFSHLVVAIRGYLSMAPGGGKTLVTNTFIMEALIKAGLQVLWLAWDWALLQQAFFDMQAQYDVALHPEMFARIGQPSDRSLLRGVTNMRGGDHEHRPRVVYSTVQSFASRVLRDRVPDIEPALMVIDEAHLGVDGELEKAVYLFADVWKVPILGLSGTPRPRLQWGNAATPISFNELVEQGYLASPVVERVSTNRRYTGSFIGDSAMVSPATYRQLARDAARNDLVVQHFDANAERYGKTLIFTHSIAHAAELARRLDPRHKTVVIHSGVPGCKSLIQRFRNGEFQVAIGINMLRHGIDVPDVKTVFLCAPTTSDIVFLQSICRASRLAPGKDHFNVVDFEDNFKNERFAGLLVRPSDYFYGAGRSDGFGTGTGTERGPGDGRRPAIVRPNLDYYRRHIHAEPTMVTLRYPESAPEAFLALDGLRVNDSQTFGLEIELTSTAFQTGHAAWAEIAEKLLEFIRRCFGSKVADRPNPNPRGVSYDVWNVVFDGSCGWEIVTPILRGRTGLEDLACLFHRLEEERVLENLGLHVDYSTGVHVHLAWRYGRPHRIRRLLRFLRRFEPALASLVAPSRVVGSAAEQYCSSWRATIGDEKLARLKTIQDVYSLVRDQSRYVSVNVSGIKNRPQRLEVRLHSGTVEASKMALWTALWMNILWAVHRDRSRRARRDLVPIGVPLPSLHLDADVVHLAIERLHLLSAPAMIERLHQRRMHLLSGRHWRRVLGDELVDRLLAAWTETYRSMVPKRPELTERSQTNPATRLEVRH